MREGLAVPVGGRGGVRAPVILAALIAIGVAATFLPVVSQPFTTFDDDSYVYDNPSVRQGLSLRTAVWAFTSTEHYNWHPLTWLSHLLDVTLFGLDARGHHAMSIFLHAVNAGLLFLALQRMTGAVARSAFVAALFGVHPLRVESVAWIAERKDLLAGLCFMLVLLAWERHARRGGRRHYAAALVLFAAGLMAKPMLVTVPFVLLLLDVWPLGRAPLPRGRGGAASWGTLAAEKLPFLALSVASAAVTLLAQRGGGALMDLESLPVGARLANAAVGYASYVLATLWPAGLAVFYPLPTSPHSWPAVAAALVLLAALSLAALRRPWTRPHAAIGWCWTIGMLVPVIGLLQVGGQSRADRYTYLPLIGLLLGAAWLALERLPTALRRPRVLGPLAGATVAACVAMSAAQVRHWRDGEALFRHALAVTTGNWQAHNHLGIELAQRGEFRDAEAQFRQAVTFHRRYAAGFRNIGKSLLDQGRPAEALDPLREATRLDPAGGRAWLFLGSALLALGDNEGAAESLVEAVRLGEAGAGAYFELGAAHAGAGRFVEAEKAYREALRVHPAFPEAANNLGLALLEQGRLEEAFGMFAEAVRLEPSHAMAEYNWGLALATGGRFSEALGHYQAALRLRPDDPDVLNNLGVALAASGSHGDAVRHFARALELRPDFAAARANLSRVLAAAE